jgi:hypothetical protein
MKLCSVCKKTKHEEEFSFRNKEKGKRRSHCKLCSRLYVKEHYKKNKTYYLDKAKKRNEMVRKGIKQYTWDYLAAHSCVDCGESDPVVLEFDHISDKIKAISEMYRNYSLNAVIAEIKKCDVRCANCHRRKTALRGGWYRNIKPS